MKVKIPWWHIPLVGLLPGSLTFWLWHVLGNHPKGLGWTLLLPVSLSLFTVTYLVLAKYRKIRIKVNPSEKRGAASITAILLFITGVAMLREFGIAILINHILFASYGFYIQSRFFNTYKTEV